MLTTIRDLVHIIYQIHDPRFFAKVNASLQAVYAVEDQSAVPGNRLRLAVKRNISFQRLVGFVRVARKQSGQRADLVQPQGLTLHWNTSFPRGWFFNCAGALMEDFP